MIITCNKKDMVNNLLRRYFADPKSRNIFFRYVNFLETSRKSILNKNSHRKTFCFISLADARPSHQTNLIQMKPETLM